MKKKTEAPGHFHFNIELGGGGDYSDNRAGVSQVKATLEILSVYGTLGMLMFVTSSVPFSVRK